MAFGTPSKPKCHIESKKDPGIPNLWPFKEKLLQEIEAKKQKAEDEKARQKLQRQQIVSKHRQLENLVKDTEERVTQFEEKLEADDDCDMTEAVDAAASGLKDNSKRAYYKEFKKVVEAADVILEILDARDPLGCRSKDVEQMVMGSATNKRIILVLNKIGETNERLLAVFLSHVHGLLTLWCRSCAA
jgi:nuclear GTP-binding protein